MMEKSEFSVFISNGVWNRMWKSPKGMALEDGIIYLFRFMCGLLQSGCLSYTVPIC